MKFIGHVANHCTRLVFSCFPIVLYPDKGNRKAQLTWQVKVYWESGLNIPGGMRSRGSADEDEMLLILLSPVADAISHLKTSCVSPVPTTRKSMQCK